MNTINQQIVAATKDVSAATQPTLVATPPSEASLSLTDKLNEKLEGQQAKDVSLESVVTQMNEHVQNLQRNLQFTVDDKSGRSVVTVMDSETDEIIRQIPSEEMLELARRFAVDSDDAVLFTSQA